MEPQTTIPIDLPTDIEAWEPGLVDGSENVLFLNDILFEIGGVPFHVEARKVYYDRSLQELEHGDTLQMWAMFGAQGHMYTHTIGGSEYIVFLYPYCK